MEFISKEQFINRFQYSGIHEQNIENFKKYANVKYSKYIKPLNQFPEDTQQAIAYFAIEFKNNYLNTFYQRSLQAKKYIYKSPMDIDKLYNSKHRKYKGIVRNMYFQDILKNTATELNNLRPFLEVIDDLFKHWVIDYKLVCPSTIQYFKKNVFGALLSSFYFRASIMNPYLCYSIFNHYVERNEWKLFTPTLGWSSYLLGAVQHNQLIQYTGIDVLESVCEKTRKLCYHYNIPNEIICKKSELVAQDKDFWDKHAGCYDIVFFSPPYYKLELYEDKMNDYTSFENWVDTYWKPTIDLCWHVLKEGGKLMFIISLYGKYKNRLCDLLDYVGEIEQSIPIYNNVCRVNKNTDNHEFLYIFSI